MNALNKFFKIEESGSSFSKEIVAGLTTFFTMAYIMFVNKNILGDAGMNGNAVFVATILAAVVGTLVMGIFANVPYAQAPGMGLNAFFTYTVVGGVGYGMGFSWQAALAMVFICGLINILITVTKVRKLIIKSIPKSLQLAIGGGIGAFIAYIGFLNVGFIEFGAGVPALAPFNTLGLWITLFGIILTVVLFMFKVKGAIILGILASVVLSIVTGFVDVTAVEFPSYGEVFGDFGAAFGSVFTQGFSDLFGDTSKLPLAIGAIFAFSITDTFDTIGTFIGTGRRSGIFSDDEINAMEESKGFKTKMDKALFADAIATSVGAVFGTSNTTTYVESAAGIEAGGRTGFTSVVVAICFLLSLLISPIIGLVSSQATACALVIVGIMMMASFKDIEWDDLSVAIPAFFAAIVMALTYSISNGIGLGFIFYVIVKLCKGEAKEINPVLWVSSALFVGYFVTMALI